MTPTPTGSTINLQATLAASSAMTVLNPGIPHHPITCPGPFWLDEETFHCEHASVPADDERVRACIIHSIAILMIEIAGETL